MTTNDGIFLAMMRYFVQIELEIIKQDLGKADNLLQKLIIVLRESYERGDKYVKAPLTLIALEQFSSKNDVNILSQCSHYEEYNAFKNMVFEECQRNYIIVKHLQN